jgi:hypothetical protein
MERKESARFASCLEKFVEETNTAAHQESHGIITKLSPLREYCVTADYDGVISSRARKVSHLTLWKPQQEFICRQPNAITR